jgi:AcrR family transcriptional regulator
MSIHSSIMARPKSDTRRAALLDAAIEVFAQHGLDAPTAAISKQAKVSEGSLFTYFKTKNELVNVLYLEVRQQLADAIMRDFPRRGSVRARAEHIWSAYVGWGVAHPDARQVARLTDLSRSVRPDVRAERARLFSEVDQLERDALSQKRMKILPPGVSGAVLKSLAEMTMDLIAQTPANADELCAVGFELFWSALKR